MEHKKLSYIQYIKEKLNNARKNSKFKKIKTHGFGKATLYALDPEERYTSICESLTPLALSTMPQLINDWNSVLKAKQS